MATKYVCDKCGNDRGNNLYRIRIFLKVAVNYSDDDDDFEGSALDLCRDCMEKIKKEANTPNDRLSN